MIRPFTPAHSCYWCDQRVARVNHLFVNGHGWTKVCQRCEGVIAPADAKPAVPA